VKCVLSCFYLPVEVGARVSYESLRYIRDDDIKEAILVIGTHQETSLLSYPNV